MRVKYDLINPNGFFNGSSNNKKDMVYISNAEKHLRSLKNELLSIHDKSEQFFYEKLKQDFLKNFITTSEDETPVGKFINDTIDTICLIDTILEKLISLRITNEVDDVKILVEALEKNVNLLVFTNSKFFTSTLHQTQRQKIMSDLSEILKNIWHFVTNIHKSKKTQYKEQYDSILQKYERKEDLCINNCEKLRSTNKTLTGVDQEIIDWTPPTQKN